MRKVIVRAPVRADLAGGTLDLWPIYLFHPGARTVNVAISYYAESEVTETGDSAIEVHLTDQQYRQRYESMSELAADPKAALVYRALEHFHMSGLSIVTRTDAPRGSGLGGSSALTITLVRALAEISGEALDGDDLVFLVRDLETRLLGIPAGIQDYYPPVYGGLAAIHLEPGVPVRQPISVPLGDLAERMLLHYTGVAHFSGTNNWEMYKRQVEGKKKVHKGFSRIAATAIEMERALESGNWEGAGAALKKEWENRKALIDGISTPEIDAAIEAATGAGAWGGKVCGAGGGGCIVFLMPPERREAVARALSTVPGRVLDAAPVAHGLTIVGDEEQSAFSFARMRRQPSGRDSSAIEQLYAAGGSGEYRPYLLAEGIVTHSEPRFGVHLATGHAYLAPIAAEDGKVLWAEAATVDPSSISMGALPDSERTLGIDVALETLLQSAVASQDAFRQFLTERERIRIFHNATFGLYSTPQETREAFLDRCMEEATHRIEDEAERLEKTFRRRIDQVRERSERDQRELEANEETRPEELMQEVNVSWGQALYNITAGRPAAVAEAQSVREVDYLERIAQIQRAWDKELEGVREEVNARARSIEEIELSAQTKNVEITRYLVLWM